MTRMKRGAKFIIRKYKLTILMEWEAIPVRGLWSIKR
jgi:hypothetical protein